MIATVLPHESWDYAHSSHTLPNGVTLTQVLLPHLHRGSIAVFLRAGSRYETAADNGLTHFLEHMIFRGIERYPTGYDLNLAVERLGGILFAATSPDSTMFEITLPKESLSAGIELLAEVVTRPVFCDIDTERKVIAEEIREDLDEQGNPIDIEYLTRLRLWPGHPLGQPVTGPLKNALRFTTDDIRRHFSASYTAANAVVCLSGAFDPAVHEGIAKRAFAQVPSGKAAALSTSPALGKGPTFDFIRRPGSQTQVQISFHAPGVEDPDWVASAILLRVLDDGMSTRLHRRIFDDLGLAYNVGAGIEGYLDVGAFNIDATASRENVAEIVDNMLRIVSDLRADTISSDEIEKAVSRAVWALKAYLDDPHAMSGWYGEQALHRNPVPMEERARQIARVGKADLERAARRIFKSDNLHATAVGVLSESERAAIEKILDGFQ